jgi:subtilisin-like proprotein convertase family protein
MSAPTSLRRLALAALAAGIAATLALAPAAQAKKIEITKTGGPIPDAIDQPMLIDIPGILTSTITVGKTGKAKKIRDVNFTFQTLGTSGTSPVEDLEVRLIAPNGSRSIGFSNLDGFSAATSQSIGPLTLDDESRLNLGSDQPSNPNQLYAPWFGTATPMTRLGVMDNSAARGTWTLLVHDRASTGTSTLVSWGLTIQTGKPFKTK